MHRRDLDYYVLELETLDGPVRIYMYFEADWLEIQSSFGSERIKLTPENALALTYVLSKFIKRVLTDDKIRSLL